MIWSKPIRYNNINQYTKNLNGFFRYKYGCFTISSCKKSAHSMIT